MPSMHSKSADAALRDVLHHIDLANEFVAGVDKVGFQNDVRTIYAVSAAWRSSPKRPAACPRS